MNRTATESYCITLEVKAHPSGLPEIGRRTECARQFYNTCLGQCRKRWRQIRSIPEWRSALKALQALNRKAELSSEEKSRRKALRQQLKAIEQAHGFSEYALHAHALTISRHFGSPLGVNEMQKAATFAWRAFDRCRFGNARKVRFKRRGDPVIIENKSNATGLRLRDDKALWGSRHARTLEFPLIVKRGDACAQQTFLDKAKFIRFLERAIRGRRRFFIQAVKEGTPPPKKRQHGEGNSAVGIDLSAVNAGGALSGSGCHGRAGSRLRRH